MVKKVFDNEMFEPVKLSNDRVEIEVLWRLGANLSSLKIDGRELIYFSKETLLKEGEYTGCFMMFPTPCRLTDSKYTFGGKDILQRKHGKDIFIHGLVRDETFEVSVTEDSLICSIEIDKNHPVYEGYQFPCRFSVEFNLLESGLEIKFCFVNTGTEDAPFGFGLHPFWIIPGERKDLYVQVPCDQTLDLVNLMPTGETTPVEGTNLDLRKYTSLDGVDIDNAFLGRDHNGEHGIEYRGLGQKMTIESADIFEHMIVYAPSGKSFVCVENLTCTPDAPNLYSRGFEKLSGLKVAKPGEKLQGWIRYIARDL